MSQDLARRSLLKALALVALLPALVCTGPALAQGKLKVAAIYTVPVEQQWVSRIHKALNAAKERGEIEYVFSENVANADYERVMRQYADGGNQLVVGEAFAVEAAARKVAKAYPKTMFLLGSSGKPQEPNFAVFDNFIQEPAYLTGMIAGAMTKSNVIGMVGGYPIPEVNRLMHAFMDGAREVNPKIRFMVTFIGSWFDPPKAKEAAFAQIDKGADLLYAERFGVSDAAKERGKLAIGNVINTQDKYPQTVVASALWNMEPTIDRALKLAKKIRFMVTFIGSWFDPPKAKEAAFAQIDKGADLLYAERFGVSDAAKERGKLAIGNVINTQDKYPQTVVASALWNMEPTIDRALKLAKEGKFKAEDYGQYSMMKYGGSELAPLGTFEGKVPADVVKKVRAKEKALKEGKATVKIDDTEPKSTM